MQPIDDLASLRSATDDPLLQWVAQGMRPGVRAWANKSATAVATQDVARRNRLAVGGQPADVAPMVATVFAEYGPHYRPLGDPDVVTALCERMPGLTLRPTLGWMHTSTSPAVDQRAVPATEDDEPLIEDLLTASLPDSLARPGRPGVTRWWVIRDAYGIAACAADAWSTAGTGLLAGVATAPRAQGRGLGKAVTRTALAALVSDYGSAALMVADDSPRARHIYGSLGMSHRTLRAAVPT